MDVRNRTKSGEYFCSMECYRLSKGSAIVDCAVCGKKVKKLKSRIRNNKSKVFCCSLQCANKARKLGIIKCGPDKTLKSSKNTYNYKCTVCNKPIGKTKYGMCRNCFMKTSVYRESLQRGVITIRNGKGYHGWQSRNSLSYPEKFFKKVLETNNIKFDGPNYVVKKKDIGINEPSCYFLDFKIGNVDLEIDGKQHWQYQKRVDSDKLRDERLTKAGYIVYRIKWQSINTEKGKQYIKNEIEKLLKFLKSFKRE